MSYGTILCRHPGGETLMLVFLSFILKHKSVCGYFYNQKSKSSDSPMFLRGKHTVTFPYKSDSLRDHEGLVYLNLSDLCSNKDTPLNEW